MDINKEYKIATQITDKKGYRQFIAFKDWEDAFEKNAHTAYEKKYIYEMILSHNPCKPYLDIEWQRTEDENVDDFITQKRYNSNL